MNVLSRANKHRCNCEPRVEFHSDDDDGDDDDDDDDDDGDDDDDDGCVGMSGRWWQFMALVVGFGLKRRWHRLLFGQIE